jgi:hypothetical protein
MTSTTSDLQASDALANMSAVRPHLVRPLGLGSDTTDEDAERRSSNFFTELVVDAFFWHPAKGYRKKESLTRWDRSENILEANSFISEVYSPVNFLTSRVVFFACRFIVAILSRSCI